MSTDQDQQAGFLSDVRIVEVADELGEFCGRLLGGLGGDVIKIEPLGGERTRAFGPFLDDIPHPNRSLHFWHYNFGKRGVVLDLDATEDRDRFLELVADADVLIDSRPRGYLTDRGLGPDVLAERNPGLVQVRISPFGDTGPWADYQGSDLIHLALGGVIMNCGYDPEPDGTYDAPPVAPQMWQAYHMVGELAAMQVIVALLSRQRSGRGQRLSASVHQVVSGNTETDVPDWIFNRVPHGRLTCRHSFGRRTDGSASAAGVMTPGVSRTKDGRWILPYRTYLRGFGSTVSTIAKVLASYGLADDLADERYADPAVLHRPENLFHVDAVVDRFVRSFTYDRDLWLEGQAAGMAWAPVRRPEENVGDAHWLARDTFTDVEFPELGRAFTHVTSRWFCPDAGWRTGPRAPMLGEHTESVLAEVAARATRPRSIPPPTSGPGRLSPRGKPFALDGVRVVDLSWFLASAGAGRFLAAHGAEVIKVEHESRLDGMRGGLGTAPDGGRAERDRATGPLTPTPTTSVNRSGAFMDINAGKLAMSLNLKAPRARELLLELVRTADVLVEGFSPGTMDRMGLGYDVLRSVKPDLVYVQQSGMGQHGTYRGLRAFGPTAQAMSGLSDMSGLPEPYGPAGIGYSYLDWFGAYQMALAVFAALYRRHATGRGCWIDSSQVEAGLYLTGTAVLDHSANGRSWQRIGNRSPYRPAAPHGVYPTDGLDRWIAIAAFTQEHWIAATRVLGRVEWTNDADFVSLADRIQHQDRLDALMAGATRDWEPFALMAALQAAGVPAGVCQTAEDRCDTDPQLAHLGWLVELDQAEIGRWPVKEVPVAFSETPPYIGGPFDRSGPNYGQDTEHVLREILGLSADEIASLAREGVL
ncbi:CoA transferase [Jatrophihabitans cynanchi]|uniref:CoA transferase n=1 Tax=Jatrophihabitans cynanchi TaxID=2944128 RepID=A0ABY7K4V9_9ACTN|nr:CoA transferase [Jatrophihabitans sp. SB3-54]WAX58364.1 CoA transferase [Jatrophihabitans sp. SB3-54]